MRAPGGRGPTIALRYPFTIREKAGDKLSVAVFAALLALLSAQAVAGAPARGQSPAPGGQVPSTLALSLGEPSPFTRAGPGLFTAKLRAEVTATDTPTKLSLGTGETAAMLRRWRQPVAGARARVTLRREVPDRRVLHSRGGLVWVTLTAGGP